MGTNEVRNARVKATGKIIQVYRHRERSTWINCQGCSEEYKEHELEFIG